jgi:histidine phosphotransfer protein HptB
MTDGPIDAAVFANLVEMTGGEMDFVDELVDTFLEDGGHQIATMRAAVASGDIDGLGRAAHSLKTGCLNIGATELGTICRSLEETARGGSAPDAASQTIVIAAAFEEARRALLSERSARTPAP